MIRYKQSDVSQSCIAFDSHINVVLCEIYEFDLESVVVSLGCETIQFWEYFIGV